MKNHKCSWESVNWNSEKGEFGADIPYYQIGGLGKTLERSGKCSICGKNVREVYIHSCILDSDNECEMDLI